MIFVTGPMFSGKEKCICDHLGMSHEEFEKNGIRDAETFVKREPMTEEELAALADELSKKRVVIASEIGGGVISTDPAENHYRENAGRLAQFLAARSDTTVRVLCGIPQVLKGEL